MILECKSIRKRFGDHTVVDDVSFYIAPGETYGLLGPNGAGKTTTISIVCGLLGKDGGEVLIKGQQMNTGTVSLRSAIGYVPQEIALYPELSARENLVFFGRLQGFKGPQLKRRVDEVLDVIGLADRADDLVAEFSGGMTRRLNIGVGMTHRPELLILDEPTVGVDPQSRNAILGAVERLATEGMAVLYTTHYMEEAERLCNRVGIIDHGSVIAEGTQRDLVRQIGQLDRVTIESPGALSPLVEQIEALTFVSTASAKEGQLRVLLRDGGRNLTRILHLFEDNDVEVRGVQIDVPDLEAVFLHLTGRALRD